MIDWSSLISPRCLKFVKSLFFRNENQMKSSLNEIRTKTKSTFLVQSYTMMKLFYSTVRSAYSLPACQASQALSDFGTFFRAHDCNSFYQFTSYDVRAGSLIIKQFATALSEFYSKFISIYFAPSSKFVLFPESLSWFLNRFYGPQLSRQIVDSIARYI